MTKQFSLSSLVVVISLSLANLVPIHAQEKVPEASHQIFKGHHGTVFSVVFNPDGTLLASCGEDKTIKLWNPGTGELVRTLTGHSFCVNSLAFSPDGKLLASASTDKTIHLWDITTGKVIRRFEGHKTGVRAVVFCPDGTLLASGCYSRDGNNIRLWQVATGQTIRILAGHENTVCTLAFNPDGTTLASGSWDPNVKLWEITTGKLIRTLETGDGSAYGVAFSPDGKLLAAGGSDKTVRLWNLATGQLFKTLEGHKRTVKSIAFSPDGLTLASAGEYEDDMIKFWRVATGKLIRTDNRYRHVLGINTIAFSPDGMQLASGGWVKKTNENWADDLVKLWDIGDVTISHHLQPLIKKLRVIKADEFLTAQEKADQIAKLLTQKVFLKAIPFKVGRYDADSEAFSITCLGKYHRQVKVPRSAAKSFKQNQSQLVLNVELGLTSDEEIICVAGVIESTTDNTKYTLEQAVEIVRAEPQSGPTIEILEPVRTTRSLRLTSREKKTKIIGTAKDKSGVASVRVNGWPASLENIDGGVKFTAEVVLARGDNSIRIEAVNSRQDKTVKVLTIQGQGQAVVESKPLIKPSLWCLAIGVSIYKNTDLNLKYAAYDAQQIADSFKGQAGKLFSEVQVKTILSQRATRDNILEVMGSFLGQASSNDVVLIFIAGHGIKHKQTGSYYFLTHDAEPAKLISRGLKWSDFEEAVSIIRGNVSKVVLLIDTCHAGAMQMAMRGAEAGEDLAETLKQAEGTYILSSCKGGEESEEGEQFKLPNEPDGQGHGAFTYAILKGLAGEADLDRDGHITIFELNAYVGKIVPKITKGRQHPYPKTSGTDMPLYLTR